MGASQSRTPEQISADLWSLGSPLAAAETKAAAFERLRAHFCRPLARGALQQAVAAVDALRFEPWPARPAGASALPDVVLADRIRGLVYGAALGDADLKKEACDFWDAQKGRAARVMVA